MAHLNSYLDACAAYGWSGGPEFKTRIRLLANGRERRNADWSQGRHRYTLPFLNIGEARYRAIDAGEARPAAKTKRRTKTPAA